MLCVSCFCFLNTSTGFPVVVPSLTDTAGFAYVEDTEELLTIPAALEYLLCSSSGENVTFEPASKSCPEVVTASNERVELIWTVRNENDTTEDELVTIQTTNSNESPGVSEIGDGLVGPDSGLDSIDESSASEEAPGDDSSSSSSETETPEEVETLTASPSETSTGDPRTNLTVTGDTPNQTPMSPEQPMEVAPSPITEEPNSIAGPMEPSSVVTTEAPGSIPGQMESASVPMTEVLSLITGPMESASGPTTEELSSIPGPIEPSSVPTTEVPGLIKAPMESASVSTTEGLSSTPGPMESASDLEAMESMILPFSTNNMSSSLQTSYLKKNCESMNRTVFCSSITRQNKSATVQKTEEYEFSFSDIISSAEDNSTEHGSKDYSLRSEIKSSIASLVSEVEDTIEDDMEEALRRLLQDTDNEPITNQETEDAILEANRTSGFLDSNGAIRGDYNYLLELEAHNLPDQELLIINVDFGNGNIRRLMIYIDSSPVSADIQELPNPNENPNRATDDYAFRIRFSTRMVTQPNEATASCQAVVEPLDSLRTAQLNREQGALTPHHLMSMIIASSNLGSCSEDLDQLDPASVVSVDGVNAHVESQGERIYISQLRDGTRPEGSVVTVNFSVDRNRKKRVTFKVGGESGVSLSGVRANEEARLYSVGLRSNKNARHSKRIAEITGTTNTALVVTALGVSFVANVIGLPMLSYFKLGPVSAATNLFSMSNAVELLQQAQLTYLVTKMAVPNLPENFIAYGEKFHWTMLDFDLPWETDIKSDEHRQLIRLSGRRLLNNTTNPEDVTDEKEGDDRVEKDENESVYKTLRRTYFWAAICFISLAIYHVILLAIFLRNKKELPGFLRLPRLELYLFHMSVAVIAGGPANLFSGNTNQLIIGIVILIVCLVPVFFWNIYILVKYVFNTRRTERIIVYELDDVNIFGRNSDRNGGNIQREESKRTIQRERIDKEVTPSTFEKYIWRPFVGLPYRHGTWTWKDKRARRVGDRYGPLYEDSRGIPKHQTDVIRDEHSNEIKIFEDVKEENRYPIDVPKVSYCLRMNEKLINLGKMAFVACFIMGNDNPESIYQAIVLLLLNVAHVLYLRVYRPYCQRWKLALALASEYLQIALFVCTIILLNTSRSEEADFRTSIGTAMLIFSVLSTTLYVFDIAKTAFDIFKEALERIKAHRNDDFDSKSEEAEDQDLAFEEMFAKEPLTALRNYVVSPVLQSLRASRASHGSPTSTPNITSTEP
eukprot:g4479.t1